MPSLRAFLVSVEFRVIVLGVMLLLGAIGLRLVPRLLGLNLSVTIDVAALVFETAAMVAILAATVRPPSLRRLFAEIGPARQCGTVALVGLILLFQLASLPWVVPYPFTHWAMYTQIAPELSYSEFIAEHQSGRIEHYPFVIVQRTSPRSFLSRFNHMLRVSTDPTESDEAREIALQSLDAVMRELVDIHDRLRPDDPIVAMEAAYRSVRIADYTDRVSIRRDVALRLEFDQR